MSENDHDYLIIGAGPAGLQLGYVLEKNGHDYVILERADTPGSFFERFPRHGRLISINKIYTGFKDPELNLRWDWNSLLSDEAEMRFARRCQDYFPRGEEMVRYLGDFARRFDLNITYGVEVVQVSKRDGHFLVTDNSGRQYGGKHLIVATGVSDPYIPAIPGIEQAENYAHVSIDPQDFSGQRVLLIGKGNSAFETANHLLATTTLLHLASPNSLTFAWRTHFVGHLRSVNNALLDSYLLKSQNILIDAEVMEIERRGEVFLVTFHYSHASGEVETLEYDRVIACTGFRFDPSPFDASCQPALVIDDRFPELTSQWESANIEGLYFAGALMQSCDYKQKQSAFIHGFRYNIELLQRLFEQKYHGTPLAFRKLELEPNAVTQAVIERVNQASSLWQQTGYFCDVVVLREDAIHYYENLTVDYAHDAFGECDQYYTVTLEFGQAIIDAAPDPFAVERIDKEDAACSELSTGIHPIIRRFRCRNLVRTHHVIEDIASVFIEDVHVDPLRIFFSRELGGVARSTARISHQISEPRARRMVGSLTTT